MNPDLGAVVEALRGAKRLLLITHDRPDGDAVGSSLALGLLLENAGKAVRFLIADPVPDGLAFLPGSERVETPERVKESIAADLVVSLDAAGRDRIGDSVWRLVPEGAPLVNIDHHASNDGFGDCRFIDPGAPATGELVRLVAEAAGWELDEAVAVNLYAAISTDTGGFRYPSTSVRTMRIATELVECGVRVGELNRMLYETYPRRRVEALRHLLDEMRFDADERCVSVSLSLAVSRELGLRPGDTEGVIDVIRAIDTVMVAVFFEELEDGRIRVSSRSKSAEANVAAVCAHFGGGGHTLAAGARLPGPLDEARERFMAQVRRILPI